MHWYLHRLVQIGDFAITAAVKGHVADLACERKVALVDTPEVDPVALNVGNAAAVVADAVEVELAAPVAFGADR